MSPARLKFPMSPDWRLAPDAIVNHLPLSTFDYKDGGAAIRVHRTNKEIKEFAALLQSHLTNERAKFRAIMVWLQWSPEALLKARNLTRPEDPAKAAKRAQSKAKKLDADKIRRRVARAKARATRIVHP